VSGAVQPGDRRLSLGLEIHLSSKFFMEPVIAAIRPDSSEAAHLVEELKAHPATLYPIQSRHGFSVAKLLDEEVDFFVIWVNGTPANCGGVKPYGTEYAEIKRIYVRPQYRGLGLGRLMLAHLEQAAQEYDVLVLRLETGIYQLEAIKLYEGWGFE
jgi:GNAT superfamily N-acetyltransferase